MSSAMNLLMVIPALDTGGAEWAFVRLANALCARHEITAYVPYACDSKRALLNAFDPAVRVWSLPLPHRWFHKLIYKLTLMFPKFDLEQRIHTCVLRMLHRVKNFAAVNPHLRGATMMVCRAFRTDGLPVVETDHGDYALLNAEDPELARHQLLRERVDVVVCPSRANAALVGRLGFQTTVIPYAMSLGAGSVVAELPRPFTFGLVARGVAEKGWAEALAAFRLLRQRVYEPVRLVFVGDGPFLNDLKKQAGADEGVIFAGYQAAPADWIAQFDVGLLPSCFTAESLPNAVIECLAQGKPVIATNVGGIPDMLMEDGEPCGVCIPLAADTGRADVTKLAEAMWDLFNDDNRRSALGRTAIEAVKRYSPGRCCEAYTECFTSVARSKEAQAA